MTTTTFRAAKGYTFSEDGTAATTWADFQRVRTPGSDSVVYEFATADRGHIAALRKLIEDKVEGYTDIVEVHDEKPARKAPAKRSSAKAEPDDEDDDPEDAGDPADEGSAAAHTGR